MAILSLCSKQAIIAPNDLINSQHYKRRNDRIPFPLTFHPHNHAVKSIIILNNFKLLQNDPETGRIFFATSTYFIQMRQKRRQLFSLEARSKRTSNAALSNVCAHDAKLSFLTLARYWDLSDLLRSPLVSHVPPQMPFIA